MSSIGDLFFSLRGDGSKLEQDAKREGERAGTGAGSTFGQRFNQGATRALTGAGAAVGTFAAIGVEQFGSFEQKMNEVFTLLPGISADAMGQMGDDVLALSRETGKLPDEVIPALYQAISAGVPPDNVFDFLRDSNRLAVGGVADLETSVGALSALTNAYGEDVLSAKDASDILFTGVKDGVTTIPELAASLKDVVPTAASLGIGFDQVTAALDTMTAAGTPTNVAGTQLRQMMVELAKDGSATSKVFEDVAGKSFPDFIASGGTLQEAMGLIGDAAADGDQRVSDLFGSVEAGSAALTLTSEEGAAKFNEVLGDMAERAGATDDAFGQMDQGIAATGDKIAATASTIAIGVGEKFEAVGPALLALNQGGQLFGISPARLFGGVGGAITGRLVPSLVGAVGAAVPALGGAMAGLATGMVGLLGAAIPIAMAALPFILVGALIAAIVAVIAIPELREKALEIGGAILGAIGDALGAIGEVFGQVLSAIGEFLGGVLGQIGTWIGQAAGAIGEFAGQVVGVILGIPGRIVSWVGSIVGQAVSAGAQLFSTVATSVGQVVATILGIPGRVIGWIGELVGGAGRAAAGFISSIAGMAGEVISTVIGIPGKVIGRVVSGFANIGRQAVDAFLGFVRGIPEAVGNIVGGIGDFIGGFIPSFDVGALDIPRDMLAMVHAGEMIIPAAEAEAIRQGRADLATTQGEAAAAPSGPTIIVNNPAPEPASRSVARELRYAALLP